MKAVLAVGTTVTDNLVEGGKRFVEQFFRRKVRLRSGGKPATLAHGGKPKERLSESVVLERTPRHDCQAIPSEHAHFERSRKNFTVMRLDLEKRTGTELRANSCVWPWLTRNGVTPDQDAYDSTYTLGTSSVRVPLPHT